MTHGVSELMKAVCVLLVVVATSVVAHAEDLSPYRATLSPKNSRHGSHEFWRGFTTRIRTEGRVSIHFTRQKIAKWRASTVHRGIEVLDAQRVLLLKGEATIRGVVYPAAASVVDGQARITFPGRERGSRGSRQRIYTISGAPSIRAAGLRISSSPASLFGERSCGYGGADSASGQKPGVVRQLRGSSHDLQTYRVIRIGTVADVELYQRHGKKTNAFVAGVINTAEALYEQQLRIRFEIVRQYAYADGVNVALEKTDPNDLLKTFAYTWENASVSGTSVQGFGQNVDVKHLFSGKDLDGTTVGMAYIGTVCFRPQSAYGLIQATSSAASPYYFAHELGHNLGALHDPEGWWGMSVMNPAVSVGSTFSQLSISQINEFLEAYGSCLEVKSLSPLLENAVLTIGQVRRRGELRLKGRLLSHSHEPIRGSMIRLTLGARTLRVKTGRDGGYSRLLRRGEISAPTKAFASTRGGETRSRTLFVRPF